MLRDRTVIVMVKQVEIAVVKGDKLDNDMIHVLKNGVVVQLGHRHRSPRRLLFQTRPNLKIF